MAKSSKRKASRKTPARPRRKSKPKPSALSMTAAARELGVSRTAIRHAIDEGRLSKSVTKTQRGKQTAYRIDIELARKEWAANTAPPNGSDRLAIDPEDDESPLPGKPNQASFNFHEARTRKESANAEKIELDVALRRGSLVSRSDARRLAYKLGRLVQNELTTLGPRKAGEFFALKSAKALEIALEVETMRIAEALADAIERFPTDEADEAAA